MDGSALRRLPPTGLHVLAVDDDRRNRRIAAGEIQHAALLRGIMLRLDRGKRNAFAAIKSLCFRAIRAVCLDVQLDAVFGSQFLDVDCHFCESPQPPRFIHNRSGYCDRYAPAADLFRGPFLGCVERFSLGRFGVGKCFADFLHVRDDLQKIVDQTRIEVLAFALLKRLENFVERPRFLIRTRGNECVEDIG